MYISEPPTYLYISQPALNDHSADQLPMCVEEVTRFVGSRGPTAFGDHKVPPVWVTQAPPPLRWFIPRRLIIDTLVSSDTNDKVGLALVDNYSLQLSRRYGVQGWSS